MKNLATALLAVTLFFTFLCQTLHAQESDKDGHIAGIVQAVLGGGDLKPARFARVYAFPSSQAAQVIAAVDSVRSALNKAREENPDGPGADLVEIECVKALIKVSPSLDKAFTALKGKQTNADEQGEFDLSLPDSGMYSLIAIGRAGLNAGIWIVTDVPVRGARQKLTKPRLACYDPQSLFKLQ